MRTPIIVGLIMHAILLAALYSWVSLSAAALDACQQSHSYETCVNTLR